MGLSIDKRSLEEATSSLHFASNGPSPSPKSVSEVGSQELREDDFDGSEDTRVWS